MLEFGVIASAAASAYAAKLRQPGALIEVPRGSLTRLAVPRRCRYCRRSYDGAVPRTCDGCGASDYEPQGFLLEVRNATLD